MFSCVLGLEYQASSKILEQVNVPRSPRTQPNTRAPLGLPRLRHKEMIYIKQSHLPLNANGAYVKRISVIWEIFKILIARLFARVLVNV